MRRAASRDARERMRLAPCRAVVERARKLGAYMQAQGKTCSQHPKRDARSVMLQTAIDLSVDLGVAA